MSDGLPRAELDRLFLYGTLMVGHSRWPILEPFVAGGADGIVIDSTAGRLYDTGLDYPAARFGEEGMIHGQVCRLRPDALDHALLVLDEVEGGVTGEYRRVTVTTRAGVTAWAWEFGLDPDGLADLGGRWTGV